MNIQGSRLEQLVDETDPQCAGEVVEMFIAEFPSQLEKLQRAHVQRNINEFVHYAHTLKGSAQMIGLDQLGGMFLEMEVKGKKGSFEGAESLLAVVPELFVEAKEGLTDFIDSLLIPHAA